MTLSPSSARTREPEAIPDVWLAFAPVKRAQTDWLVEKATELGAARLIPVITAAHDRRAGQARAARSDRDRSCRAMRPDAPARDRRAGQPQGACSTGAERRQRPLYFADESGGEPAAEAFKPGPALILIGPEGGFTDEERALVRAATNAVADLARPAHPARRDRRACRARRYMAVAGDWRHKPTGAATADARPLGANDDPHRRPRQPDHREPRRPAVGLLGRRKAARRVAHRHRA